MTHEQLEKMTPEEKRIRIAEICGYKVHSWGITYPDGKESGRGYVSVCDLLPDYLNDLNAMHEAENLNFTKPENAGLANAYRGWLVNMNWEGPKGFDYSASERADAFLLTLG